MAKILSVYNRLQAGDYENGNGGKRRVSRLTQFIHATLQLYYSTRLTVNSSHGQLVTEYGQNGDIPKRRHPKTAKCQNGDRLPWRKRRQTKTATSQNGDMNSVLNEV